MSLLMPCRVLNFRALPLPTFCLSSTPWRSPPGRQRVYGTLPSLPGQFLSTLELPPSEFLNNLHRLVNPFVPPPLVHRSSPPSGPVHPPPALCSSRRARARTRLFAVPLHSFASPLVTVRTRFRSPALSPYWLLALLCLLHLDVMAALLDWSLVRPAPHAVPRHRGRPKKDPPPLPCPLQLRRWRSPGFDPAQPGPQGLGWSCNGCETPCINVLVIELWLLIVLCLTNCVHLYCCSIKARL